MSQRLNHFCQITLFTVAIALTNGCAVNQVVPNQAKFGSA